MASSLTESSAAALSSKDSTVLRFLFQGWDLRWIFQKDKGASIMATRSWGQPVLVAGGKACHSQGWNRERSVLGNKKQNTCIFLSLIRGWHNVAHWLNARDAIEGKLIGTQCYLDTCLTALGYFSSTKASWVTCNQCDLQSQEDCLLILCQKGCQLLLHMMHFRKT